MITLGKFIAETSLASSPKRPTKSMPVEDSALIAWMVDHHSLSVSREAAEAKEVS